MSGSTYSLVLTVLFLQQGTPDILDSDETFNYANGYEGDVARMASISPRFFSESVDLTATVGDTVTFPCEAQIQDTDSVLWMKKENDNDSSAEISTLQDDRFRVVNGTSLQISAVVPTDSGFYSCHIASDPESSLLHTLIVRSRPSHSRSCPGKSENWIDLGGDYCYLIELANEGSWINAVYNCFREGGTLASFPSMEEVKGVQRYVNNFEGALHIGLWKHNDGSFEWGDKNPSTFRNWAEAEPNERDETCVEMYLNSGKWNDIPCSKSLGYICSALKSPSATVSRKVCPDSSPKWTDYGTEYCYIIELYNEATSDIAAEHCSDEGGSLASFHSVEEISVVIQQTESQSYRLHIGLRQNSDKMFEWMDRSPLDLEFWDEGEPNDVEEKCGEMILRDGQWNDIPCDKLEGYICSTPKVDPEIPATEPSSTSAAEICGGDVSGESGSIQSLNYPENYNPNEICLWKITVPENFQVQLSFQVFQLEYGADCEFDYVEVIDGVDPEGTVLRKLCGSHTQVAVLSSGNKVNVKFSSDQVNQRSGFFADFKTVPMCGGNIAAEEGIIQSRDYPDNYWPNDFCEWKITVPENNAVLLKFQAIAIERSTFGCKNDYVEILDGHDANSSVLTRDCGFFITGEILSSGHKMTVRFVSDSGQEYYGFSAEFKKAEILQSNLPMQNSTVAGDSDCAKAINYDTGTLFSPGYPSIRYRSKEDCTWTIRGPPGSRISLRFNHFELEKSSACQYDYVEVHDGPDFPYVPPRMFCGKEVPDLMYSSGNQMVIRFKTDSSQEHSGFSAIFSTTGSQTDYTETETSACERAIDYEKGTLSSPGYPGMYSSDEQCTWTIRGQPGSTISLRFKFFELEPGPDCQMDYVEIREDPDDSFPHSRRFCGDEVPELITSSGNQMTVHFKTDSTIEKEGFAAVFNSSDGTVAQLDELPGELITSDEGVIKSPNYPEKYGSNEQCSWKITVSRGHQIVLNFRDFKVETHAECAYDYVLVRDGHHYRSPVLYKFCGYEIPNEIRSTGNKLMIEFKSDSTGEYTGFSADFKKYLPVAATVIGPDTCGGDIYAENGTIRSPNYPKTYGSRQECMWKITVPEGNLVSLKFEFLDLEHDQLCGFDSVTILDGDNADSPVLDKLCMYTRVPRIISSTNKITVNFTSDDSFEGKGFEAKFERVRICGESIVADEGVLQGPNGTDGVAYQCKWRITVPQNYTVVLRIHEDRKIYSPNQYFLVEIRDSPDTLSSDRTSLTSLEHKHRVESLSNEMFVTVTSDGSMELPHFFAEFRKEICGGDIFADSGIITSRNYPDIYEPNENCTWTITVPENYRVILAFLSFDLEGSSGCRHDYLEVIDGLPRSGHILTRSCGQGIGSILRSSSNTMSIRFVSDASLQFGGFSAEFQKESYDNLQSPCGGNITALSGVLTSPEFPNSYPPHSACNWTITVPEDSIVSLHFTEFDLEPQSFCLYDSVQIFDGDDIDNNLVLGKFCGWDLPDTIRSSTNKMSVRFTSDHSNQFKGFSAEFIAEPTSYPDLDNLLHQLPEMIFKEKQRKPKLSRGKKKPVTKRSLLKSLEATFKKMV